MIASNLGNILAPYTYTSAPMSRGQSNTVPADAGNMVYRSPTANAYENEPGAVWHGRPIRRFTSNGYLMGPNDPTLNLHVSNTAAIGPSVAMIIGGAAGAALVPGNRVLGTVIGALAGGILGVVFSG